MQGVFGSGVTFYLQSWCISVRGPLYSAMFNPLCTVITTAVAAVVLREELHVGRCASRDISPPVKSSLIDRLSANHASFLYGMEF